MTQVVCIAPVLYVVLTGASEVLCLCAGCGGLQCDHICGQILVLDYLFFNICAHSY